LNSMAFSLENICLGDVLDIRDGTHDTPKYIESGIPLITSKNLTDYGLCFRDISFISEADHNQISNRSAVESGDILYGMIGTIGKPTLVETDRKFSIKNVALFKQSNPQIHNKYLRRLLNSPSINSQIAQASKGGTQKFVSLGALRGLKATFPSFTEQRRIAAILDQADALRTKRREALEQLDSLTQSIFIEMFGDPGSNTKKWPVVALSELIIGKPNNGIFKKNDEYGAGLPVVWVEELFRGNGINCSHSRMLEPSKRELEQYGLHHGDVLFCRSSLKLAGIGYNNVYLGESDKALFECHVIRISPDKNKLEPMFLNFALRMPNQRQKLFKHAKTVTMSTIDQDGLLRLDLPIPPLNLQKQFAGQLDAIEELKTKHANALAELNALFASLQHRAFRGEL